MTESKRQRFIRLYSPVHDRFERFCRARVYGEMEYGDLMNETVLRVMPKLDSLKSDDAFLSFLFTSAIRLCASSQRKMRPMRLAEGQEAEDQRALGDTKADIDILYANMAKLPKAQQESLLLFEVSGFSITEIAAIHKVGESAVKQRLRRGRIALADLLADPINRPQDLQHHG